MDDDDDVSSPRAHHKHHLSGHASKDREVAVRTTMTNNDGGDIDEDSEGIEVLKE